MLSKIHINNKYFEIVNNNNGELLCITLIIFLYILFWVIYMNVF